MRADNTIHLISAARRRSADATERVRGVLRELRRTGERVTIAGVARQAGVSRTFLHSQPELLDAIEGLRVQNDGSHPIPAQQRTSEESLRTRLEALLEANKKLRQDNTELRRRLELALGDLRHVQTLSSQNPPPS